MKKQRLRDITLVDISQSKQSTFDKFPEQKVTESASNTVKSIEIAQLSHRIKESELELSIAFRLLPSKNAFSDLMLELYFDNNKLQSYQVSVPPSQLLGNELEFPIALDMNGICPGEHTVKVEIYELWQTGQKLTSASKYVSVQYSPSRKEDRYIKIPIVKKIDGAFRIIMPEEQGFYEQLEKDRQKELNSKRDDW